MKKKRIFLSLILMMSMLCFSACGKTEDPDDGATPPATPAITQPTVNVSIYNRPYYIGDELSTIALVLAANDTSGTVVWDNPEYVLVAGDNECAWTFTPTDTNAYYSKTGSTTITAVPRPVDPEIVVTSQEGTYYEGDVITAVALSYTPTSIEGTLEWLNKNEVLQLGTKEYTWKFTPTDTATYAVITGKVEVTAIAQYLSSIAVKTSPTKSSGYKAFETIDDTGMDLNLIYNKGKRETINSGWTISYNQGTTLLAGDTKATVTYQGFTCDLIIDTVSKIEVEKPTIISKDYTGSMLTAELTQTSSLYTLTPTSKTTAGEHNAEVVLTDPLNYEWVDVADKPNATATVVFKINKIALVVIPGDENEALAGIGVEYDGEYHTPTVSAVGSITVYYSTQPLNELNYALTGSTTPVSFKEVVSNGKSYYYIVGDENHLDALGELTVNITEMIGRFNSAYSYVYTIETGNTVEYPEAYKKVYNAHGDEITGGTWTVTYYVSKGSSTKTSVLNSGASGTGKAPVRPSDVAYGVFLEYSDGNVNASAWAELYIDEEDTFFVAGEDENKFAFRYDTVTYANDGLAEYYLEFELGTNSVTGLKEITYISKMGAGVSNNSSGYMIYKDGGYSLIDAKGITKNITFYQKTSEQDSKVESITLVDSSITLEKWEIPGYLGTYSAQTIADGTLDSEGQEYLNKVSSITFYNDLGTIRFTFNYNVPLLVSEIEDISDKGGSGTFNGIVVYSGEVSDKGVKSNYICHITEEENSSTSNTYFYVRWPAYRDAEGNIPETDPTQIYFVDYSDTLYGQVYYVDNLIGSGTGIKYTKKS